MRRWEHSLRPGRLSHGERFVLYAAPCSFDPSGTFKDTTKELFGRLTQTLTGHGYTGEYYQHMHIPDTSPWFPCSSFPGAPIPQTRLHILTSCPLYAPYRHLLKDALFDPDFSVYRLVIRITPSLHYASCTNQALSPSLAYLSTSTLSSPLTCVIECGSPNMTLNLPTFSVQCPIHVTTRSPVDRNRSGKFGPYNICKHL